MTEANVEPVSTRPAPDLEPVAEDWQRALCVVAHPDDLEFGAAAAAVEDVPATDVPGSRSGDAPSTACACTESTATDSKIKIGFIAM